MLLKIFFVHLHCNLKKNKTMLNIIFIAIILFFVISLCVMFYAYHTSYEIDPKLPFLNDDLDWEEKTEKKNKK